MRRLKRSTIDRAALKKKQDQNRELDKRRRRLYNRMYRKSIFFIAVWAMRILFVATFFIVCATHYKTKSRTQEIAVNANAEEYTVFSKRGTYRVKELHFETTKAKYTAKFDEEKAPSVSSGDTLTIERNMYGKPIYFTKAGWKVSYALEDNLMFYYIILFVTFISFFFNDGFERFTDKLLLIVWGTNVLAIAIYFLT